MISFEEKKSGTQNAFSLNCASSNWPHCGKIHFVVKVIFFEFCTFLDFVAVCSYG